MCDREERRPRCFSHERVVVHEETGETDIRRALGASLSFRRQVPHMMNKVLCPDDLSLSTPETSLRIVTSEFRGR